ncbi:MAG: AbrB/MazE/SpoVT family DNA-binding domain-containing protein [Candidatus Daviesbacteria bacterium]|nr:AbrB/MazE/SpoVT family DNA-binding domain-containing protein [Candidatus Daviesbacteria bacterium]
MKQVLTNESPQEYLRILGKGMVTIPKEWRDELGLKEGGIVKAEKVGNKLIIEAPEENVPYRTFSDVEIEQWLKADRLTKKLSRKIDLKLKSLKSD